MRKSIFENAMWEQLLQNIRSGDIKKLSRAITLIENEADGYEQFLQELPSGESKPVLGITGPPGAGKSTLTDALLGYFIEQGKKVAVLCIDPSSPFNHGAVLGDRIRMSQWYEHPSVFIRSLATRGALGGLHPKIIEITDVLKASPFDMVIIETVGVGQSEVEIAGLADVTIVVVVPEAGDEVQTMKAGLMEIADVFVVNKADRPDADTFVKNLRLMLAPAFRSHYEEVPILKTVASRNEGVSELADTVRHLLKHHHSKEKKHWLLAEKAWQLIQKKRMSEISKNDLRLEIEKEAVNGSFNLYKYILNK